MDLRYAERTSKPKLFAQEGDDAVEWDENEEAYNTVDEEVAALLQLCLRARWADKLGYPPDENKEGQSS